MSDPVGTAGAVQYYVNSSTFGGDSNILHIDTSDSNLTLARSAAASELTIKRTSTYTGTNSLGNLIFDFAGDSVAGIGASRDGADDAAALQFFTQATGGANTERMRIDSSGRVGIGATPSSSYKLLVDGDICASGGHLHVTGSSSTASGQSIYAPASNTMALSTNGTERMRIDSSGVVTFGGNASAAHMSITSAGSTSNLTVQAGEANIASIQLSSDDGDDASDITILEQSNGGPFKIKTNNGGSTAISCDSGGNVAIKQATASYALDVNGVINCTSLRFADGTSISTTPTGTVLLRDLNPAAFNYDMHVAGKVGVGTDSPAAKLVVAGNSDSGDEACAIHIIDNDSTGGSSIPSVSFRSGASTQIYAIQANDTYGLQFRNASDATKITFDPDGNVGIGTTSPTAKLHIVDASDPVIKIQNTSANPANGGTIHFIESTGTDGFKIHHDGNENRLEFQFVSSSSETTFMTLKRDTGNVGIGTSSPAFKTEIVGDTLAIHDGAGEGSGRILFDEQSDGTYGFSTGYVGVNSKNFDGVAGGYPTNTFFIARHNNSKSLTNVLMSNRDNGHIGIGSGWGSGSSVYPNSFLHSKGPERLGIDARGSATKLGLIVEDTGGAASDRITGMVEIEYNATGKTTSRICTRATNNGSKILFLTSNNYSSGVNGQPLTLSYNARIGINNESPSATLDIYNDTNFHANNAIRLRRADNNNTWAQWDYDSGTCNFGTAGSDHLSFRTNGAARMTLHASNGGVGIGTTNPAYRLDVDGTIRCGTLIFKDGTSFSSVGAVGNKAIAVNVGGGSSNPEGRAKSVVDASYGGIQNGLVLVYYYYNYSSHCGNGGCTRTAYAKRAYQVVDGNWSYIFGF